MPHPESMLPFLAAAAREAREAGGRRQVHIAARLNVGEATIIRFESGRHWPRSPDRLIAAYAVELDVEPLEIWTEALRRWEQER